MNQNASGEFLSKDLSVGERNKCQAMILPIDNSARLQ